MKEMKQKEFEEKLYDLILDNDYEVTAKPASVSYLEESHRILVEFKDEQKFQIIIAETDEFV